MVGARSLDGNSHMQAGNSTQRGLAASLIECMGRETAMHVCQINGWDGVLEILRDDDGLAKLPSRH